MFPKTFTSELPDVYTTSGEYKLQANGECTNIEYEKRVRLASPIYIQTVRCDTSQLNTDPAVGYYSIEPFGVNGHLLLHPLHASLATPALPIFTPSLSAKTIHDLHLHTTWVPQSTNAHCAVFINSPQTIALVDAARDLSLSIWDVRQEVVKVLPAARFVDDSIMRYRSPLQYAYDVVHVFPLGVAPIAPDLTVTATEIHIVPRALELIRTAFDKLEFSICTLSLFVPNLSSSVDIHVVLDWHYLKSKESIQ